MSNQLCILSGTLAAGTSVVAQSLAASRRARVVSWHDVATHPHWQRLASAAVDDAQMPLANAMTRLAELDAVGRLCQVGEEIVWDLGPAPQSLHMLALVEAWPVLVEQFDSQARLALQPYADGMDALREAVRAAELIVVTLPARGARGALRRVLDGFDLLGLDASCVVINRVPRRADGWPKGWTRLQRARSAELTKVTRKRGVRTVKVREALEDVRIAKVVSRDLRPIAASTVSAGVHEPVSLDAEFFADADRFRWILRLGAAADRRLRAGRIGSSLVLARGEAIRQVPLPSVLARCTIVDGVTGSGFLELVGEPDPSRWRRPAAGATS